MSFRSLLAIFAASTLANAGTLSPDCVIIDGKIVTSNKRSALDGALAGYTLSKTGSSSGGNGNIIIGNGVEIHGNRNFVQGDDNFLSGNQNYMKGFDNNFSGSYSLIVGDNINQIGDNVKIIEVKPENSFNLQLNNNDYQLRSSNDYYGTAQDLVSASNAIVKDNLIASINQRLKKVDTPNISTNLNQRVVIPTSGQNLLQVNRPTVNLNYQINGAVSNTINNALGSLSNGANGNVIIGNGSTVIGNNNQVIGNNDVLIGNSNNMIGSKNYFIGDNAFITGNGINNDKGIFGFVKTNTVPVTKTINIRPADPVVTISDKNPKNGDYNIINVSQSTIVDNNLVGPTNAYTQSVNALNAVQNNINNAIYSAQRLGSNDGNSKASVVTFTTSNDNPYLNIGSVKGGSNGNVVIGNGNVVQGDRSLLVGSDNLMDGSYNKIVANNKVIIGNGINFPADKTSNSNSVQIAQNSDGYNNLALILSANGLLDGKSGSLSSSNSGSIGSSSIGSPVIGSTYPSSSTNHGTQILISPPTTTTLTTSSTKSNGNVVIGDGNEVRGNNNYLNGNVNVLQGNDSGIKGSANLLIGSNSKLIGDNGLLVGNNLNAKGNNIKFGYGQILP